MLTQSLPCCLKQSISLPYRLCVELVSSIETETETAGRLRGCIVLDPSDRREPLCWSGQQFNCRQHGNSNAIAAGTWQHTLDVSLIHGVLHNRRPTYNSGSFLQLMTTSDIFLPWMLKSSNFCSHMPPISIRVKTEWHRRLKFVSELRIVVPIYSNAAWKM